MYNPDDDLYEHHIKQEPWWRAERLREKTVRTLPCKICDAMTGRACIDVTKQRRIRSQARPTYLPYSHTGRYMVAMRLGLVPAFAGGHVPQPAATT